MSVMAVINLTALFLLAKKALGVLKDFESQKGVPVMDRTFDVEDNPYVTDTVPGDVWHTNDREARLAGNG